MQKLFLLLFVFVITFFVFSSEEVADQIDANTLQGLTKEAFVTTNDFENLKLTIERIKGNRCSMRRHHVRGDNNANSKTNSQQFMVERTINSQ